MTSVRIGLHHEDSAATEMDTSSRAASNHAHASASKGQISQPLLLKHAHRDLIHDAAFDFYGRRMATCSTDQCIEVWDKTTEGVWVKTAAFKAHTGSVWRVDWAHPEFGQLIATCSFDHSTYLFEETSFPDLKSASVDPASNAAVSAQAAASASKADHEGGAQKPFGKWTKRRELIDCKSEVYDIQFAPRHMGLKLAACSVDGSVRVYDCPNVSTLNNWTTAGQVTFSDRSTRCLSWNPSPGHAWGLAVGWYKSQEDVGGVNLIVFDQSAKDWKVGAEIVKTSHEFPQEIFFAPNLGRSYHLLAVICTKTVRVYRSGADDKSAYTEVTSRPIHEGGRAAWNVTGTILTITKSNDCIEYYSCAAEQWYRQQTHS